MAITAPVPFSCAPVTIVPVPSGLSFTYAPAFAEKHGHHPQATPIVFPAWFPQLTAQPGALEPIYRVRLSHNEVAGAPEMVVYRVTRCGG